ncbi:MAG: ACT domain-containing protein [Clostridiales bacterium]|mgnify:FL=1|nr:ACT domain-containing protein [Clostridiales bacterium]
MTVNQVAVFLENAKGRISDLCQVLADADINVFSMTIADTSDFGIVRVITSDNEKAEKVLKEAGFAAATSQLLGIEIEDKAGRLAQILAVLKQNDIDIEYLYSYITKMGTALILVKVKDIAYTEKVLADNGIKLLNHKIF